MKEREPDARPTDSIKYRCYPYNRKTHIEESISPFGLDTEAYTTGECFMLCTSEGDIWTPEQFPDCLFSRKYRGQHFVTYNLKYDSGAMVQRLNHASLVELQKNGKTVHGDFKYSVIGYKCLTIRKGKNSVHFWDMLNFYCLSLNEAAKTYLGEEKIDYDTKRFSKGMVQRDWDRIAAYCIRDAELVQRLSAVLIKRFERFGVYPRKLYSVAYVSYQYFRKKTPYVTVKRYWQKHREVLDYALRAYNGGKFEVTRKGPGYYYEYDIVSAYPYEISNLVDISWARVVRSTSYRRNAVYGFLKCHISIPGFQSSPVVVKRSGVNCYPVGDFERVITLAEYDYMISQGCDVEILDGYWLHIDNKQYPYRQEIQRLVKLKQEIKSSGDPLDYHVIKVFLNSLYGKMAQLINKGDYNEASSCWNPIYASIITSNCRIRMSALQAELESCVAVHTDSILTTRRIACERTDRLGSLSFEGEGKGIILGSGVYQVGEKTRFRGATLPLDLFDLVKENHKKVVLSNVRPYTWREVAHRHLDRDMINRFSEIPKELNITFDQKRIWIDDYNTFSESLERNVESVPLFYSPIFF